MVDIVETFFIVSELAAEIHHWNVLTVNEKLHKVCVY